MFKIFHKNNYLWISNLFTDLKKVFKGNIGNIDYIYISFFEGVKTIDDPKKNIFLFTSEIEIVKLGSYFEIILRTSKGIEYLNNISDIKKYVNDYNFIQINILKD